MVLFKIGYIKIIVDNFVIDFVIVFIDFKYDKEKEEFIGIFMGVIFGGVEIKIEFFYCKVEVDGVYIMDVVGLNVFELVIVMMKVNLIELIVENLC